MTEAEHRQRAPPDGGAGTTSVQTAWQIVGLLAVMAREAAAHEHAVNGEEVAGDDARRLGAQELSPART